MIYWNMIINELKEKRKVFHSEDDLKLAIAMEIYKLHPGYNLRLERPTELSFEKMDGTEIKKRAPIDIVVIDLDKKSIPIEIKYKTKKCIFDIEGEDYSLTEHGACDIGRYSFRKDIVRIEKFFENDKIISEIGYVFILTNENKYFEDISKKDTYDKNFSFHDKVVLKKEYAGWYFKNHSITTYDKNNDDKVNGGKMHWTNKQDLNFNLILKNEYEINWKSYSIINNLRNNKTNSEFKYCLIEVKK